MADPLTAWLQSQSAITVLAGAVGSLVGLSVAAWLTFHVQNKLARRRRKEEERRTAYVHLVQISQLAAAGQVVKDYIQKYWNFYIEIAVMTNSPQPPTKGEHYSEVHFWCAAASVLIGTMTLDLRALKKYQPLLAGLDHQLSLLDIPTKELVALPEDAIQAYYDAVLANRSMRHIWHTLSFFLETGDKTLLDTKAIYLGYVAAKEYSDKVSALRGFLVIAGSISPQQATKLYDDQYKAAWTAGARGVAELRGPGLAEAEAAVRKLLAENEAKAKAKQDAATVAVAISASSQTGDP